MKKFKTTFTVFSFFILVNAHAQDVSTQFEGGIVGEKQAETLVVDYEAAIAQLILQRDSLNCKIIEDFDEQMTCEGKFEAIESKIRLIKNQQEISELAQKNKKLAKELAEKSKRIAMKKKVIAEQRKRIAMKKKELAQKDLAIAALKALKKVKEKMQSE